MLLLSPSGLDLIQLPGDKCSLLLSLRFSSPLTAALPAVPSRDFALALLTLHWFPSPAFQLCLPLLSCVMMCQRMGKFLPIPRDIGEKMTTFREKIDKLLVINGEKIRTIEALEEYSGLGSKTLRRAYTENREPTPRTLGKLFSKFGIDSEAWYAGEIKIIEEKPTSASSTESKVNSTWINEPKTINGDKSNTQNKIPFYDTVAVGGTSMLAEQDPQYANQAELIDPGTWFKSASGALRVYGHSMFPKYPAGCIVAFKESEKDVLIWGEDYVIELKDRRIVKRVEKSKELGCISAVSYNKSEEYVYSSIDIPVEKIKRIFMVMGKVEIEASI